MPGMCVCVYTQEDLRLLCPRTGSSTASLCREVDRWEDCSYADAPGHAWVGRPNWHSTVAGKAAVKSLEMASKVCMRAWGCVWLWA
eukprot:1145415-Pelagomonas_calceolata.AAC.1